MIVHGDTHYLMPGEIFFGTGPGQVRTLLGSCVAAVLWHPRRHLGGMCHFVLPSRGAARCGPPDGRYGDEAFDLLGAAMARAGTAPGEYLVGIYGGGDMFTGRFGFGAQVGTKNIALARQRVAECGCSFVEEECGGAFHRSVGLALDSGEVTVRRTAV